MADDEKPGKSSSVGLVVPLLAITLAAASCGVAFGFLVVAPLTLASSAKTKSVQAASGHTEEQASHDGKTKKAGIHGVSPPLPRDSLKVKELPPLTTNLGGQGAPWIKLEAALLYDPSIDPEIQALSVRINEDLLAYLRSVRIAEIESSGGFHSLVEDMNERVQIRSGGKVRQLIVSGFILE